MNTYFTADTHFGHPNIIKYCNRPFSSVYEMDAAMIANWNRIVKPNDVVYHLGDFAFCCTLSYANNIFYQLNGIKHLILGNHDALAKEIAETNPAAWASVSDMKEININGQKIVLCHYPMRTWHHAYKETWHLFGHVHGRFADYGKSTDAGVDCWNFAPVSFVDLRKKMAALSSLKKEGS